MNNLTVGQPTKGWLVFSVFQDTMPERGNLFNHAQAARDLDEAGLTYEVSEVSFKGVLELGFTIRASTFSELPKAVVNLLNIYEQEIVLWTDDKGQGRLFNPFTLREVEL